MDMIKEKFTEEKNESEVKEIKEYHKPVLVSEVLQYLSPLADKIYVDATFGGGGHSRAILEFQPKCKVIGIDWDQKALDINTPSLQKDFGENFKPIHGNFANLQKLLKKEAISHVDGILADFGTSQYQMFHKEGFSFSTESELDMRMAPGYQKYTAYDYINKLTEKELADVFYEYGEERYSRRIAKNICFLRQKSKIKTTKQLADIVKSSIPYSFKSKIHPATKVFQALRILVNNELENIKSLLNQSISLLNPEGRLVCISFHSLEDRIVKQFLKEHKNEFLSLTKKVVIATPEEIKANFSSRSAKLRAAQKLN